MKLFAVDWLILALVLWVCFVPALFFSRRAGKDTTEYFASGRSVPWSLAGLSMVATTFNSDTPNCVKTPTPPEPPQIESPISQSEIARKLALKEAKQFGLSDDWLNDQVKQFLAEKEAKRRLTEVDLGEGRRVSVPTAAYLLAMKLRAARPPLPGYAGDRGDIRYLVKKMEITSVAAAEAVYGKFFPHDVPSDAAKEEVRGAIAPPQP